MKSNRSQANCQKKWATSYDEEFAENHQNSGIWSVMLGSVVCMAAFSVMLLIAS